MRRLLLALSALLLLTGCTSSSTQSAPESSASPSGPPLPDAGAFAAGTCQAAAPDVLEIGRAIPGLAAGDQTKQVPEAVRTSLRTAQDRLAALAETAEPAAKPALDQLVVSVGLVRIRADGNEYSPDLGAQLSKDYEATLAACGASG